MQGEIQTETESQLSDPSSFKEGDLNYLEIAKITSTTTITAETTTKAVATTSTSTAETTNSVTTSLVSILSSELSVTGVENLTIEFLPLIMMMLKLKLLD